MDYVDCILSYILRRSNAQAAAAHDGDVYAIFPENQRPPSNKIDFIHFLEQLAPQVDTDQDGLGMLVTRVRGPSVRLFPSIRTIYAGKRKEGSPKSFAQPLQKPLDEDVTSFPRALVSLKR
ncbi:hypothetical protein CERSUDRAFT_116570 [Gelatoporia subvermispora B]|uniref:Uncharacterized protein n=1 Tax=Ceriporiopsis subvermispora (strain B) TaxID=914234 RepID=M2PGE8_CERS8|nr:hypothetical protein CERSUDRAFT_116570 [Gelatoporia subvermispora B]